VTRTQYDRVLRFQEETGRSYSKKQYYTPEVENWVRIYRWAEMKRKTRSERYWEHYNVSEDPSFYSETEEEAEEGSLDQERGPFSEVLRSAFISLFLLHTFGSLLSLAFSSLMALFDRQLDAGYKIGYLIAWILGGRGGISLVLCLQFASWACGKRSSSMVALVVVAMWVGSNLARFAPLPQGALVTLLYMSIKLQADLNWSVRCWLSISIASMIFAHPQILFTCVLMHSTTSVAIITWDSSSFLIRRQIGPCIIYMYICKKFSLLSFSMLSIVCPALISWTFICSNTEIESRNIKVFNLKVSDLTIGLWLSAFIFDKHLPISGNSSVVQK